MICLEMVLQRGANESKKAFSSLSLIYGLTYVQEWLLLCTVIIRISIA